VNSGDALQTLGKAHTRWRHLLIWYINIIARRKINFAFELTKRSASDSLQKQASSLLDAQVDLNPHQVEAALFAFHSPLQRLLELSPLPVQMSLSLAPHNIVSF
jgi:hypothetical protein